MSHRLIPTEEELLAMNGGKPLIKGGERVLWFGSNPSDAQHTEQATEEFDPAEKLVRTDDRVLLTDYPKMANGGVHPAYNWQQTGSCVHGGAFNAVVVRTGIDACVGVDPVPFTLPFMLPAYALSRKLAFGRDSEGEGSSGDAMAVALAELGSTEWDDPAVAAQIARPKVYDIASTYTAQEEMRWSRYGYCPEPVKAASKAHTIRYVKVTTIEQAEAELRKLRPITIAGNWGSTMGAMRFKGTGANRVLIGEHTSSWEHQQSLLGVWRHPELGRLWLVLNQWYYLDGGTLKPVHGGPATDEPAGSYWVTDQMVSHQLNYRWGELRSIKSLKGYDHGKIGHMAV